MLCRSETAAAACKSKGGGEKVSARVGKDDANTGLYVSVHCVRYDYDSSEMPQNQI